MSRPLRIEFPGALYHITGRGNARQRIDQDDADRKQFLATLAHVVDRDGYRMSEIAEYLGVHYSTVSRRLKRAEKGSI